MRYRGIERIMFLSSIEKIDHPVGKESTAIFLFEKKMKASKVIVVKFVKDKMNINVKNIR